MKSEGWYVFTAMCFYRLYLTTQIYEISIVLPPLYFLQKIYKSDLLLFDSLDPIYSGYVLIGCALSLMVKAGNLHGFKDGWYTLFIMQTLSSSGYFPDVTRRLSWPKLVTLHTSFVEGPWCLILAQQLLAKDTTYQMWLTIPLEGTASLYQCYGSEHKLDQFRLYHFSLSKLLKKRN